MGFKDVAAGLGAAMSAAGQGMMSMIEFKRLESLDAQAKVIQDETIALQKRHAKVAEDTLALARVQREDTFLTKMIELGQNQTMLMQQGNLIAARAKYLGNMANISTPEHQMAMLNHSNRSKEKMNAITLAVQLATGMLNSETRVKTAFIDLFKVGLTPGNDFTEVATQLKNELDDGSNVDDYLAAGISAIRNYDKNSDALISNQNKFYQQNPPPGGRLGGFKFTPPDLEAQPPPPGPDNQLKNPVDPIYDATIGGDPSVGPTDVPNGGPPPVDNTSPEQNAIVNNIVSWLVQQKNPDDAAEVLKRLETKYPKGTIDRAKMIFNSKIGTERWMESKWQGAMDYFTKRRDTPERNVDLPSMMD